MNTDIAVFDKNEVNNVNCKVSSHSFESGFVLKVILFYKLDPYNDNYVN